MKLIDYTSILVFLMNWIFFVFVIIFILYIISVSVAISVVSLNSPVESTGSTSIIDKPSQTIACYDTNTPTQSLTLTKEFVTRNKVGLLETRKTTGYKIEQDIKYGYITNADINLQFIKFGTIEKTMDGVESNSSNFWFMEIIGAYKSKQRIDGTRTTDIFILDTGIDATNNYLNVVGGYNAFTESTSGWNDLDGHGTFIAGSAAASNQNIGIATGSDLYAIKVLDDQGEGDILSVVRGLDYVIQYKKDHPTRNVVANLSLGAKGISNLMKSAVEEAVNNSIVVCVASGNESEDASLYTPARIPQAITVSSYDDSINFSSFSNFGCIIDILCPGNKIISTFLNNEFAIGSGTSMSAGIVSGVIALIMDKYPNLNPFEIYDKLFNNSLLPTNTYPKVQTTSPVVIESTPSNTIPLSLYCGSF